MLFCIISQKLDAKIPLNSDVFTEAANSKPHETGQVSWPALLISSSLIKAIFLDMLSTLKRDVSISLWCPKFETADSKACFD